jgi:hypothetical protein
MGSTTFGGIEQGFARLMAPQDIASARGTNGCAMASDCV